MAKQVRLTLAQAIAKANQHHAEPPKRAILMSSLAVQGRRTATPLIRLVKSDNKAESTPSLDRTGKIVKELDCRIEDLPAIPQQ